jgi:4-carboxymuconolactone decarboxylase
VTTQNEPSTARRLVGDIAPKLAQLTDEVLFGDVWRRPELARRDRSLITVAALVTNGSTEQLVSHLRLAKQNGLTETELVEAIIHLAFYAGWPRAMSAITVAKRVFGEDQHRADRAVAGSPEENKKVVAGFVEVCQNQHDLSYADEIFHPQFVNHYAPEGRPIQETPDRPAAGFQRFYGMLLQGFPDATMRVDEQLAERDLVATRKTFRGTHTGQLWDLPPSGNRVEWDFIDIMRVRDGKIVEHWTSMDLEGLRAQVRR